MTLPSTSEMYRALVERDQSFEGLFFACVRTTGIFCRPTCHARKPKPENVEFAPTIQEALHRGYRPCQLCEPMSSGTAAPNWLAPLLDEIKQHPDLKLRDQDLRARGLDPVQVRRTFKRSFGMTFQAYQRACRLGTAMKALHGGAATIDAGMDAGFESDSGFRDAFAKVFGDTPGRARGTALLTATWIETPLGPMLAIAGDAGLELLEFVDRRALETELRELRTRPLGGARSSPATIPSCDGPRTSCASISPARGATSTCRWRSTARRSSSPRGRRSARSLTARPGPTPTWRAASARPAPSAPSAASTARTRSRSSSPATASSAPTGRSAATAAAAGESSGCWITRWEWQGGGATMPGLRDPAYICL